jgi:hypothetical protein
VADDMSRLASSVWTIGPWCTAVPHRPVTCGRDRDCPGRWSRRREHSSGWRRQDRIAQLRTHGEPFPQPVVSCEPQAHRPPSGQAQRPTRLFGSHHRSATDARATTRRYLAHTTNVCLEKVSARMLAVLIPQRDQAAQVHWDVVGLALVRVLYLNLQTCTTRTREARSRSSGQHHKRG